MINQQEAGFFLSIPARRLEVARRRLVRAQKAFDPCIGDATLFNALVAAQTEKREAMKECSAARAFVKGL